MLSEAEKAKLKQVLWASKDTIQELEAQIKEKEENITKGEKYSTLLETKFGDTSSKAMVLESEVKTINLRLRGAEAMAREAEERAEDTKDKA